jgi:hypothetical protein
MRFRRLSVPTNMQFVRTSVKNVPESAGRKKDKENAIMYATTTTKFLSSKDISALKRMERVNSD